MKPCFLLLALLAACRSGWGLEIPITVEEPAGVARQTGPVTGGICLPRGKIAAGQVFRLFDGSAELPLQVTPLVVERDGSLRWILLDFPLNIGARETKRLILRTEASATRPGLPGATLRIAETTNALTIDTGRLRLTLDRTKPFVGFGQAQVDGGPAVAGDGLEYVEAGTGTIYRAGPPRRVSFEYRGSFRVTVRIEGQYEGSGDCRLGYITRLTAWAGRADIRLQHILANSNPEQVYHANLRSASIKLRHGFGPGAEARVGAGQVAGRLDQPEPVWLHQGKVNRYYRDPVADATRAGVGESVWWSGADSGGWVSLREGGRALLVCDRDFQGDPPRRLVVDRERVTVELVAAKFDTGRGVPHLSDHPWLYDLSHKAAEVWLDFAPGDDFDAQARAARSRLLAFAPGDWYAHCDVFGVGRFGTLEDEKKVYQKWGWKFEERQLPRSQPDPHAFVRWEDNHYESEADSPEALLLMAIRTGQRGFFDQGEAWARYHACLHAWRTDGWAYDDGAIWFPQGGPLGTKPARRPPNVKYQHWDKGSGDDRELWHLVQAKSCYCHFYGAGLVDHFLLTGERDSLEAAIDLAEQKNSEFRKHRQFTPGQTTISDTRGFGRGFYVLTHVLEAVPDNEWLADLTRLCRDVLWNCPNLDERGFAPSHLGTGFGGFDPKRDLSGGMRALLEKEGTTLDENGWLTDRSGRRWPVVCLGGTWQHAYVQTAADRYAHLFNDEDLADFAEAFGRFAAKFLLSEQCKQTWYYAYMDVPVIGQPWDPWKFDPSHLATRDGEGCEHEGYYTRFFPDAIALAFSRSGDSALLDRARTFWHYGSKRGYRTKHSSAGWDSVGAFATHFPPKDDTVLSTSRLFHEWARPRSDASPPHPIGDLAVSYLGGGRAAIRFTAPADADGGPVARYQVKCAPLPIVAYDEYDFARDERLRRNWWRAANVQGEPIPAAPGKQEQFTVTGIPEAPQLYFVVASADASNNRSPLSNLVRVQAPK